MYYEYDETELLEFEESDEDSVFLMQRSKKVLHIKKNYNGHKKFVLK